MHYNFDATTIDDNLHKRSSIKVGDLHWMSLSEVYLTSSNACDRDQAPGMNMKIMNSHATFEHSPIILKT